MSTQPSFGLLQVSGPNAEKFLQGQLSCHLAEVTATESRLGAHCNPQGRVLFLFRIFLFESSYYLVLPQNMLELAKTALAKYAVFFKVELQTLIPEPSLPVYEKAAAEWSYFDPRQGHPQVYPETSGLFLPHDLNLHKLDGIHWDKGCYTGQEIIARMHYLGKLKTHLYQAKISTPTPPSPGDHCMGGTVVDCLKGQEDDYQLLLVAHEKDVAADALML